MDDLDRKLIAVLREDARRSISQIARLVGVSRSTIQSRIERLLRDGVIERFTVDLGSDYENRLIRAHVLIKVDQALTQRAQSGLQKLTQVTAIYAVSGEYDLIAIVAAESTAELNRLLDGIAALDGIERTRSSVVLETKLPRRKWKAGKPK